MPSKYSSRAASVALRSGWVSSNKNVVDSLMVMAYLLDIGYWQTGEEYFAPGPKV